MYRLVALTAVLIAALPPLAGASWPERLVEQRAAFREAWPKALDGDAGAIRDKQFLLADYPLYPDLQAAWLRSQVGRVADDEIERFVTDHGRSSAVRDLRYRWARSLASRGEWQRYLSLYESVYADSRDETLACLALTGRLRNGPDSRLADDVLAFWMHGESRASECDPVFEWVDKQGLIDDDYRRRRIELALDEREFELASWLARPLPETDREFVQDWRRMRHRPADYLKRWRDRDDSEQNRELLVYGLKRLARSDIDAASEAWDSVADRYSFTSAQRRSVLRYFALTAARNDLPQAGERILSLERGMVDDTLLEYGARAALKAGDWPGLLQIIGAMSATHREETIWRYWRARALEGTGRSGTARAIYAQLAGSRGYYPFLAADRLAAPYEYNHRPATVDEALLSDLGGRNDLVRARELFFVNLHGKGRSEWDSYTSQLARAEKAQSAILASRWGWYSRAIATAARAGLRDDLSLTYPIAFRELFEVHTADLGLPTTWAFGIARSESLFMPDVSSSAGALGLMQLMPATGRSTARQASIRYRGRYTLLNPEDNIALGTFYLDRMYARFDDHQVLATAAYNAGPHRVARWLPDERAVAADIWVDTVPFRETRGYLRRVLAADVIFHWRLSGDTRRLAAIMPPVPASTE